MIAWIVDMVVPLPIDIGPSLKSILFKFRMPMSNDYRPTNGFRIARRKCPALVRNVKTTTSMRVVGPMLLLRY
jgi:hypothetical protein